MREAVSKEMEKHFPTMGPDALKTFESWCELILNAEDIDSGLALELSVFVHMHVTKIEMEKLGELLSSIIPPHDEKNPIFIRAFNEFSGQGINQAAVHQLLTDSKVQFYLILKERPFLLFTEDRYGAKQYRILCHGVVSDFNYADFATIILGTYRERPKSKRGDIAQFILQCMNGYLENLRESLGAKTS